MLRNRPQQVFWAVVVGDVLAIATTFWLASLCNPRVPTPEIMVTLPLTYLILACVGRVHASIRAVEPRRSRGRACRGGRAGTP